MTAVLAQLAVFAVVIATGWGLVRLGGVPAGADEVLTRTCFHAATPALLLTTMAGADLATVLSHQSLAGLAAESLGVLTAWALHRWVLRRSLSEAVIGALASGYVNSANLGIPVLVVLLGDATAIAPVLLLQLLVLSPLAFVLLDLDAARRGPWAGPGQGGAGTGGGGPRARLWVAPLRNPLLLAVLAGLAVNLAGWDVGAWAGGTVAGSLDALGALAVPLMMLALGMSLAATPPGARRRSAVAPAPAGRGRPERARRGGRPGQTALWLCVAWKTAVVPLAALGTGAALGLRGHDLLVPVTTAALPCAQNVFMYATRYGAAKELARDAVLWTTALFVPVELLARVLLT